MLKKLIVLISIFTSAQVFAVDVLVKAGANNSWFANEGGTSETMPAYGIGVQFPLDETHKASWCIDVLYVGQKMVLKDRSWPASSPMFDECRATIGDLYLHYHYLKLPVYLNRVVYQSRNISTSLNFGLSINLTLESSSGAGNRRHKDGFCDYDYDRVESDVQPRYPIEFIIGTGFFYKKVGLDVLYSYTLGKTEFLYSLTIQDNVHSIRMMLSWHLKKTN